jgi:hypothetical protein
MTLLGKLAGLLRPKPPSTLKDLADFLESRAAFVAQKSLAEYSQARANMLFSTLLGEKGFRDSYEEARWRAYPATLSMVAELLAGQLRDRLKMDVKEAERVASDLSSQVISKMRGHGPLSNGEWDAALSDLQKDLARSALAAPVAAHTIAKHRAREAFDALPFHSAIKQHDFTMFRNTLAFHLTEAAAELEQITFAEDVSGGPAQPGP